MRASVLFTYDIFLPNEKHCSKKVLIEKIPHDLLLQYMCNINYVLHTKINDLTEQDAILNKLLINQSEKTKARVYYLKSKKAFDFFIDLRTSLKIIDFTLQNYSESKAQRTSPLEEFNIFLLILLFNQDREEEFKLENNNLPPFEKILNLALPLQVITTEISIPKNFLLEAFRSQKLKNYILNNPDLQKGMEELLSSLSDQKLRTQDYFIKIYNLYTRSIVDGIVFYRDLDTVPIINKWILDPKQLNENNYSSNDYRTLRSYPILKVNGEFHISNWNFILDKLYNGFFFDLVKHSRTIKEKFKNIGNLKNHIGTNFSEDFIFNLLNILNSRKEKYIIQKGDEGYKNFDFYLRKKNNIAFIENKDLLFLKKETGKEIKEFLDQRIVKEKGINQILKQIKKLSKDISYAEKELPNVSNEKKLKIHPIIVVSDIAFTLNGIEYYANNFLQNELKRLKKDGKISNKFFVHPVTIILYEQLAEIIDYCINLDRDFFYYLHVHYKKRQKAINSSNKNILTQFNGIAENLQLDSAKKFKNNSYFNRFLKDLHEDFN